MLAVMAVTVVVAGCTGVGWFGVVIVTFSAAIKTTHSGPSETALRLRRFPMRVPAARRKFFCFYIQINDFLYEIHCFRCFYGCIFDQNVMVS